MNSFSLKGKTAVLTGAARGLGLAFAQALAEAGANIAVLDVIQPEDGLDQIRTDHGVKVEYYKTNVTSREEVTRSIEKIEEEFGGIDINVNAAGVVTDEPFLTTSDQNLESTFAVNFKGSFLVAQACANAMVRKRQRSGKQAPPGQETANGSIVFIASIATHIGTTVQHISCYGIRVNSLSPGYMMTDMMRGLQKQQPQLVAQFEKETMFGRIGYPDELKGAMLFLCSQASGWYTGQDLLVDGGASSWKHPASF